jgi:hypothetical protein
MPVRTFRIFLSNNTQNDLVRTAHVLCPALGGDPIWTSPAWEPPLTIPARSERAWQSESNGIAVGCSGFVKYRIAIPALAIPGGIPPPPRLADEIYIYWVNPFSGGVPNSPPTKAKGAISSTQVNLDCDPDGQPSTNRGAFADPVSQFEIMPEVFYDQQRHPDWTYGRDQNDDGSGTSGDETARGLLSIYVAGLLTGGLGAIPATIQALIDSGSVVPHAWARFCVRTRGSMAQCFSLSYNPANGIRRALIPGRPVRLRTLFAMLGG